MADSVADSWSRVRAWLDTNAPDAADRLQPAASEAQIQMLEAALGMTLPSDLRAFLEIHNGGDDTGIFPSSDSFDMLGFSPLATEEIVDAWRMLKELVDGGEFGDRTSDADPGIRSDWWCTSWIPIASNGGGDFQCVDLSPTDSGTAGQIIGAWHDDNERQLIAPSLADYLRMLADGLESGKYAYEEDDGIVQIDE